MTVSRPEVDVEGFSHHAGELIKAGWFLHDKGWVPATSSNFSSRVDGHHIAITASGRHKGELDESGIMLVDYDGEPLDAGMKPSAETGLHTALYRRYPEVGAVLHTHSVNATVLSRLVEGQLVFEDYELLKAFPHIQSHESRIVLPIFDNDQDIPRLNREVEVWLDNHPDTWGYLIAGHGLYTWGRDMQETLRHIEALEFLFQCEITLRSVVRL